MASFIIINDLNNKQKTIKNYLFPITIFLLISPIMEGLDIRFFFLHYNFFLNKYFILIINIINIIFIF